MLSIKGYTVLITGASSGIGAACAEAFAAAGARLILAARRTERVEEFAARLAREHGIETLPITLDVRDYAQVQAFLGSLPANWQAIDILLNNAGLARGLEKIQEGHVQDWDEMIDTNVKGLLYVTRTIAPGMVARGRGHIFNIGSIAGKEVYPNGNVYCASKHAVDALNRAMRIDLAGAGLRVTAVDPGMVETEFSLVRFHGDDERAQKVYQGFQPLTPEDIADVILFCATRPSHVNIQDVVVMCTAQASATIVSKK